MLRLFGPARVSGISGPRLPRAAYLAAAFVDLDPARSVTRDALAAHLWDASEAARANLRQLLSRIRGWEQQTGLVLFRDENGIVSRSEATLPSDLTAFLAIRSVDNSATLRLLSELYGGDFLVDAETEGEATRQWLAEQRTALRERFVKAALTGVRATGGPIAEDVMRRLLDEAPYDDVVVREAMVSSRRDPARVRSIYDRFAARLKADLGHDPDTRTTTLLRELTRDAPAAAQPAGGGSATASVGSVPRLLILPPAETGFAVDDHNLALSLIDEVTHALSRLRTFAVFAPHTARQLVTTPFPGGNPYGADYLVSTRLAPGADVTRLGVALTRIATHEVLLSEELRFSQDDLNAHHFHLAAALGTRLARGVERSEQRIYRTTGSASAYVSYLLGSEALKTIELASMRRARSQFRRAIRMSPDFVPARAGLSRALCLEWLLLDRREREPIEDAIRIAREATDIDPMDPSAHREVGQALIYLDAIDEGVASLRAATQLGPHNADALFHYADGLVHQGEMGEARKTMQTALALNPLAPDLYFWVHATADYFLGDYASASAMLRRMKNREPAARVIAAVEAMNGDLEEAHRHRDIYLAGHPDFRLDDYMIPQRRPEDRAHYLEGLRRAGFA